MSKVIFIDQGHPDDNYYDLEDTVANHGVQAGTSDLTLEEMGLTLFAAQLEVFIQQVGPVLGGAVIDVMNMNEMCMTLSELQKRER
jgi:hypothetical protein